MAGNANGGYFDILNDKKRYSKREIKRRPMTFFRESEDRPPLKDNQYITKISPHAQVILSPRHISPGRYSNKSLSDIMSSSPVPIIFTTRPGTDENIDKTMQGLRSADNITLRNPTEESLEESAEADGVLIQRTQSMIMEAEVSALSVTGRVGMDMSSQHSMITRGSTAKLSRNKSLDMSLKKNSSKINKSLTVNLVSGKIQNTSRSKDTRMNDDSYHDSPRNRSSKAGEMSCSDADSTKNNPACSPCTSERETDMEEVSIEENSSKPVSPIDAQNIPQVSKKRSSSGNEYVIENRETRHPDRQEAMLFIETPVNRKSNKKTSSRQYHAHFAKKDGSVEATVRSETTKPKRRKRNSSPVKSLRYYTGKDHIRTKRNIVDLDFVMDCIVSTISEARENCDSTQLSSLLKNFKLQAIEGIAQTIENLEMIRTLRLDVAESRRNITALKRQLLDLQQRKELLKSESNEEAPRLAKLQSISQWINSYQSLM